MTFQVVKTPTKPMQIIKKHKNSIIKTPKILYYFPSSFLLSQVDKLPLFSASCPASPSHQAPDITQRYLYAMLVLSIKFRNSERKACCYLVNIRETEFGFRQNELYLYSRRAEGRKHWRLYCLFSYAKGKNCR